jgi:glycosyltransferase involved in cell wall biosynthesis
MLEKVELFLYRRSDLIIAVTNSFKAELISRGINAKKISVVLNGVDLQVYQPREKDNELRDSFNLKDKFVIGYLGTIGLAHAVEVVIEAAEKIRNRDDISFLIVGGGANAERIRLFSQDKNLSNLLFMGRQSKSKMPAIWSLCDLSIVHLRNSPLFSKVIPSKIFESWAMGLPVLIGVPEGEATKLVRAHDSGVVIDPESPEQIAESVLNLCEDRTEWERLRNNCLDAAQQFDRKRLALDMLKELEQVAC